MAGYLAENTMKRHILAWLLILSLTLSLLPVVGASGAPGEEKLPDDAGYGFTYRFVTADTIEITSYYGYEAEVTVPSTIDGYTVVGIESFHDEEGYSTPNTFVTKVILPDTVTYIADEAFYDSDDWSNQTHSELREIVLPEGLKTIGEGAFYNNYYLQAIEIPAGVTEIGKGAFAACSNLSSIVFKGENTFLHGGAFGEWTSYASGSFAGKLNELYYDWLYDDTASDFFVWQGQLLAYKGTSKTPVIPNTVTVIGAAAFWRADITGVTIPSSVKQIGGYAFYECTSLTSVDIPGSVERIDDSAFSGCTGLTSVTLHKGLKVIGDGGFRDCEGLTSLDLPEGLTTLEDTALYDCENIEHFTFPASLVDMEESSIYTSKWYENLADGTELYCGSVYLGNKGPSYENIYPAKLTVRAGTKTVRIENYLNGVNELILPDGLETLIIKDAGTDCGITKLTVPESVNYIDLNGMSKLTDITLPTTAVLAEGCFYGCYQIKNLTIPKGNTILHSVNIGQTEQLVLPDDVLEVCGGIGNGSPYSDDGGNSYLKSVDLNKVRILRDGALSNSVALETVTLPDSLIMLGDSVFSGCSQLRSVKGGKNVRQIGISCFNDCSMLTDFGVLETNVTRVGLLAFLGSGWFHDQPNGVVYFGKVAYAYKGAMAEGTVLKIKDGTVSVTYQFLAGQDKLNDFDDQPNLAGVILPESCKYVDGYAFANAVNMKFMDLGGVQYIGESAFNNSACEAIVLPDSVRYVGDSAFAAPYIRAIHLNDGLRVVDEGAFFTYGEGSGVTIPASVTYIGLQAFGYCPIDPEDPFGGLTTIDGFTIRGTAGSAAQTYAADNGFTFETTDCTSHQFVTETVEATCQTGGYTRQVCAVCGYTNVTSRTSAVGHKAVANDTIEATCTRPGSTGGTHCAYCGQTLTNPTPTAALGHDWVVATEEYEYSAYYGMTRHYCRRCELKWYEASAGGHTHDYSYSVSTVYPTCTTQGYTIHTCSCGDSYTDNYTAALGHDFVNGVCSRCGATEGSDPSKPCDGGADCPSRKFVDVDTKQWYHPYVDYAVTHGLFGGTSDHTFEPEAAMTRAMLVTVLWRYEGQPKGYQNTFTDVNAKNGGWYIDAVAWAAANGVVNGVGNGRFDPEGKITREQMATILFRYAQKKGIDTSKRGSLGGFSDAERVSVYAKDALQWAVGEGIINGSDGKLLPQGSATRAQVATILMRYIENIVKK